MRSKLKSYIFCVLGWTSANLLFMLIRFVGLDTVPAFVSLDYNSFNHELFFYKAIVLGILLGSVFYLVSRALDTAPIRRRPYWVSIVLQLIVSLFSVTLVLIALKTWEIIQLHKAFTLEEFASRILTVNFLVLLTYYLVVSLIMVMTNQIDRKFGPGNLRKLILGVFYHPRSIEHIFMFLDLKDSTSHAERLGHIKFGNLIQDCFMDMSVVSDFGTSFYQYVGDEAILYWEVADGMKNANCLQAYFAFIHKLDARKDYYWERYGMIPEFKAGANIGMATVMEVGEIKREIAYLGDVLNTAARIQGMCKVYKENLLISEWLFNRLKFAPEFLEIQPVGTVELRGRTDAVRLFRVREKSANHST